MDMDSDSELGLGLSSWRKRTDMGELELGDCGCAWSCFPYSLCGRGALSVKFS